MPLSGECDGSDQQGTKANVCKWEQDEGVGSDSSSLKTQPGLQCWTHALMLRLNLVASMRATSHLPGHWYCRPPSYTRIHCASWPLWEFPYVVMNSTKSQALGLGSMALSVWRTEISHLMMALSQYLVRCLVVCCLHKQLASKDSILSKMET